MAALPCPALPTSVLKYLPRWPAVNLILLHIAVCTEIPLNKTRSNPEQIISRV